MTVLPSYFQIRDVHRPNLRKHLDTFERFALTTQPTNKIRTAKIIRNVYLSLGYRTPKIIWTKGLLSNHICNALIHKIFKTDLHSDSLRYGRLGWVYYDDARHDPDIANSTLGQITENISDCLVSIVRRHIKWHRSWARLRETLLIMLVDIRRQLYGFASVDVR